MTKTYLIGTGYLSSNIAKQIKNSNSYGIPLISAAKGDIRKIIQGATSILLRENERG